MDCEVHSVLTGIDDRPTDSEFVCTPGNNIPVTALCDGFNDCGNGNDETTVLCESEHSSKDLKSNSPFPTQTSAGYHIMEDVPSLESALRQRLM